MASAGAMVSMSQTPEMTVGRRRRSGGVARTPVLLQVSILWVCRDHDRAHAVRDPNPNRNQVPVRAAPLAQANNMRAWFHKDNSCTHSKLLNEARN